MVNLKHLLKSLVEWCALGACAFSGLLRFDVLGHAFETIKPL